MLLAGHAGKLRHRMVVGYGVAMHLRVSTTSTLRLPAAKTRRDFLQGAAASGMAVGLGALTACANPGRSGAVLAQTAASRSRVFSSNETVRIGVIGLNGRGWALANGFARLQNVRIAALCDCDKAVLDKRVAEAAEKGWPDVAAFSDPRRLLESGAVDAVAIATPNHWHSLLGVWAAEHSLHAYVEKPVSHDVWEGMQLAAAAERHGVVIAGGTQSRSNPGMQAAIQYVREGALGPVRLARGLCYKPRGSIGLVGQWKSPPESVDYDVWLGPAPQQQVRRRRFHYDWHWQWDFGNGDLGNQGVHQMDLCRWGIGADDLPDVAFSFGGRIGYEDDGETPNTQCIYLGYERAPIVFEVRGLRSNAGGQEMDKFLGARIGVVFHCEEGYVVLDSYSGGYACRPDGEQVAKFEGGGDHHRNFVAAVRAGDNGVLTADARQGHLSAALCHLGNQSVRGGEVLPADEVARRVQWNPHVAEVMGRLQRHIEANELPASVPLRLGRVIRPATMRWMPRDYREGYRLEPQA
jgi:predicted dehydrogenase